MRLQTAQPWQVPGLICFTLAKTPAEAAQTSQAAAASSLEVRVIDALPAATCLAQTKGLLQAHTVRDDKAGNSANIVLHMSPTQQQLAKLLDTSTCYACMFATARKAPDGTLAITLDDSSICMQLPGIKPADHPLAQATAPAAGSLRVGNSECAGARNPHGSQASQASHDARQVVPEAVKSSLQLHGDGQHGVLLGCVTDVSASEKSPNCALGQADAKMHITLRTPNAAVAYVSLSWANAKPTPLGKVRPGHTVLLCGVQPGVPHTGRSCTQAGHVRSPAAACAKSAGSMPGALRLTWTAARCTVQPRKASNHHLEGWHGAQQGQQHSTEETCAINLSASPGLLCSRFLLTDACVSKLLRATQGMHAKLLQPYRLSVGIDCVRAGAVS